MPCGRKRGVIRIENFGVNSRNFFIIEMQKKARKRYVGEFPPPKRFCFTREIRRAKRFSSEEEAQAFLKECLRLWKNPVRDAVLRALRSIQDSCNNYAVRKLNPYLWRYVVSVELSGGFVIANSEDEARRIVTQKYQEKYAEQFGGNLEILVWPVEADYTFDPKYATVIECY